MRVGRVRLTHLDLYIFNMKELIFQSRGVCGKSVKYVGSHKGIHDMTRAGSQGCFTREDKTTMLRGAGLLDGRTNSTEEKLGCTREFSGHNCSLPLYTDLGLPVSRSRPVCLRKILQTLRLDRVPDKAGTR